METNLSERTIIENLKHEQKLLLDNLEMISNVERLKEFLSKHEYFFSVMYHSIKTDNMALTVDEILLYDDFSEEYDITFMNVAIDLFYSQIDDYEKRATKYQDEMLHTISLEIHSLCRLSFLMADDEGEVYRYAKNTLLLRVLEEIITNSEIKNYVEKLTKKTILKATLKSKKL